MRKQHFHENQTSLSCFRRLFSVQHGCDRDMMLQEAARDTETAERRARAVLAARRIARLPATRRHHAGLADVAVAAAIPSSVVILACTTVAPKRPGQT